jgi:hypothetical protein
MATAPIRAARHGSRKMQFLIDKYKEDHPDERPDLSPDKIAQWAIEKRLWRPIPLTPREQLRKLITRCFRETYLIDPQGREVRASLPIMEDVMTEDGLKHRSRWFPIFSAPANVARASFSLRRKAALADVAQLQFDFMSWSENNLHGDKLDPMDYNFNKDLAELAESTEYIDNPLAKDSEEDDDDEGELV